VISSETSRAPLRLVEPAPTQPVPPSPMFGRWTDLIRSGAPDTELVRLAFDHFHDTVFTTASRIVGNPWEAEDVTQSVFENLVRRLSHVRDPATLPGFLKTCTVRMSLRQVKRQRWRRRRLEALGPVAIPSDGPSRAALVRQLLAQLDEEERVAVVLKHVEQHSHEEVAEYMGVSVPTARRRLASARAKLLAMLGEDGVEIVFGDEDGWS
jgi:RNA polymerase sigma-70 factor, ECF subfamily